VSALIPLISRIRFVAFLCVILAAAALTATAWASGYWNVWQGNLPGSDGMRAQHTLYGGCGYVGCGWVLRLSWTSGTHDMNFSLIANNGSWSNYSAETYGAEYTNGSYYDRVWPYSYNAVPTNVAKAGCENPAGKSTVFTNCRNADTF